MTWSVRIVQVLHRQYRQRQYHLVWQRPYLLLVRRLLERLYRLGRRRHRQVCLRQIYMRSEAVEIATLI